MEYTQAPLDNPLKGLVPYAGDRPNQFPHSLEFNYLPLSALVTGHGQYDWRPLENLLNEVARRGHQTVFRVYLEYPGKTNGIPAFLVKAGLKVHKWRSPSPQPQDIETPDYADPNLREVIKQFILALGKKYDGDPRIGFITAGLLGLWGEWHDFPRDDLFADNAVQTEVMDAYEAAFKTTPVLLRYPAGESEPRKASNATRRFGYHDDSFAWATIETGSKADEWSFMALMKAAGLEALNKWKTQPIGGEIRPEAWGKVFDPGLHMAKIQDFRKCVEATHVSWLMDSGMFPNEQAPNVERTQRAGEEVRRMGYEFHLTEVTVCPVTHATLSVKVEVENRGVAPFYYDWPVEFGLLGADGNVVQTFAGAGKITGLLPGDPPRVWISQPPPERAAGAIRKQNPRPKRIRLVDSHLGYVEMIIAESQWQHSTHSPRCRAKQPARVTPAFKFLCRSRLLWHSYPRKKSGVRYPETPPYLNAPVAQLDRATDF